MHLLKIKLSRYYLSLALKNQCGSRISRSGKEGELVNCFSVVIDKVDQPYLFVLELINDELICLEWNGQSYEKNTILALDSIPFSQLQITHYYGLSTIRYFGILNFIVGMLTLWPYIKIRFVNTLGNFDQYIFNKKKFITKQRIDLLRFLVSQVNDGHDSFNAYDLMFQLYTIKWILHPNHNSELKKLEFYLRSLCDTGELRTINHEYILTGHALRTIEEYEEQERKHTENVKMQWRMFWLTLVIACLTLVQSGLIKLSPLLDLT